MNGVWGKRPAKPWCGVLDCKRGSRHPPLGMFPNDMQRTIMAPTTTFCPNWACPARGQSLAEQGFAGDGFQRPVRRSSSCTTSPSQMGRIQRRSSRSTGLPEPERAREQEHADKAEHGEKTLKLWLGETRVTQRKLDCLKSNAHRSMEGLSRQRLRARGPKPFRRGQRTA